MIDWKAFKSQAQANPKRVLGFVIGLATCFFVMWAFILTKSNINMTQENRSVFTEPAVVQNTETTETASTSEQLDPAKIIPVRPEKQLQTSSSSDSSFPSVMPIAFLFAILVGGFWLMKSKKVKSGKSSFMEIVGSQQLGVNQQVSLLYINNEYWVVGHSNGQMNLLHRYNEEEWFGTTANVQIEAKDESRLDNTFLSLLKREHKNYEAVTDEI